MCCRRTYTGAGLAVAALTAMLTLTGCSGDASAPPQSTNDASTSATPSGRPAATTPGPVPSATPTATPTTPTSTSTSAPTDDSTRGVEGVWLATHDSSKVQLVLGKGKAGLTSSHVCGGTYTDEDGIGLALTCMDGDKERTVGHGVLAADGKTLTVRWTAGPLDTFSRTGLPSN